MPPEAAEAGADQRLSADGGGVYQEPGTDEAFGRETGGLLWLHMPLTHLCCILWF